MQMLKSHQGSTNFAKAARQFLLKWSFYSSMVIRDLTLRSAASFGSFHLIRLLYDEYMFFLIEHKVAQSLGETPIGVMGNGCGSSSLGQSSMMATSGHDNIDLPSTAPTAQEVSLPRDGASIDAMLIDHEMLTKPNFDISTDTSPSFGGGTTPHAKSMDALVSATSSSTPKLHSIPTSATININNNNANSLTTMMSSGNNLVELQTEYGPNAVIQVATGDQIAGTEIVSNDDDKRSITKDYSVKMSDEGNNALSQSASTTSLASSSTVSLVSSSSIISLNASVGVIKQAGNGGGASVSASTAEDDEAGLSRKGQTFVVVQTPSTVSAADQVTKREVEDIDVPSAKRLKTQ